MLPSRGAMRAGVWPSPCEVMAEMRPWRLFASCDHPSAAKKKTCTAAKPGRFQIEVRRLLISRPGIRLVQRPAYAGSSHRCHCRRPLGAAGRHDRSDAGSRVCVRRHPAGADLADDHHAVHPHRDADHPSGRRKAYHRAPRACARRRHEGENHVSHRLRDVRPEPDARRFSTRAERRHVRAAVRCAHRREDACPFRPCADGGSMD